ncbi:MAG: response regulator [Proteobacteria bacterium]|nr:response regulator [Pseudomonadota bacterium]
MSINKLKYVANEIGKGNLGIKLDINSGNEIGQLSNSFNSMAEDLGKYHKNLEKMVNDRTAELRNSNELLQQEVAARKRAEEAIKVAYDQSIIYAEQLKEQIGERRRAGEEQKLLEAQLIRAQKMEAIGTLAGGIAHDFNNTLQVILGYAQLLLDNKKGKDIENSYIKTIEKSAQRAAELTSQLLVFSRKVESELRPVSLNQELIKEERLLRRTISQMIDIELKPAENLNIINADPAQLGQIIMNLAINARDAMPNGGKLIFETKNIILDEKYCKVNLGVVPGGYVLMSVSDTGNGMDKDTLEHIFEPFYTTKQTGEGTWLGLSMVYGIVKSHGGHITCNSKPGHGTVFNIYFPVIKEIDNLEQAEPKNEAEIYGGNETVLIVDDVKSILELGQYMLSPYGYKIIKAENGEEAIKIYKTEKDRIDLVILDIDMPGMGGDKCLQELLKINPDIKAIIASGYTGKLKIKEFMKNGAAGYVCKPYRLEDMLKNVREVLGNSVEERA